MKVEEFSIYSDSQIVINQLVGEYKAQDDKMSKYLEKEMELVKGFKVVNVEHISSENNSHVFYSNNKK